MHNQHESFLALAAQIAQLHEAVQEQKEIFLSHSSGDPFAARRKAKDSQGELFFSLL